MCNKNMGHNVRNLRKRHSLTQIEFANKLGVSKGTVAMWETGKRSPRQHSIEAMSILFDMSVSDVLFAIYHQSADIKMGDSNQISEEDITITVGEMVITVTVATGTPVSVIREEKR